MYSPEKRAQKNKTEKNPKPQRRKTTPQRKKRRASTKTPAHKMASQKRKPTSLSKKRRRKIKWGRLTAVLVVAALLGYSLAWFIHFIPQIITRLKTDILQLTEKASPLPYSAAAYRRLSNELGAYLQQQNGAYGVYGIDLDTGASFGWNGQALFTAANTSALPAVLTLYRELELRQITPGKLVHYEPQDTEAGSGFIGGMPYGTPFTVLQLARASIAQNDIVARNMLVRTLGTSAINHFLAGIGVDQVFQSPYVTTPQNLSLEMAALYKMANAEPQTVMPLVNLLEANSKQGRIANGFPSQVNIAQLPANWPHEYHDTALVYDPAHPLVLSICSDGASEHDANLVEAAAARLVDQFIAAGGRG